MSKIKIRGGKPLFGEITVSGGKNAALPVICAAMLSNEKVELKNVPNITDVISSLEIIRKIGGNVSFDNNIAIIDSKFVSSGDIPFAEASKMRSSALFAGALLGMGKKVLLPKPGGCRLGKRPLDMHIEAFAKMGASVKKTKKGIMLECNRMKGADIYLKRKSVGATENIMLAAVLAKGRTTLQNAACEPEITALAKFLNSMGAYVKFVGTDKIIIDGVSELGTASCTVIPDRIEAGTYLCAAAAAGGEITLKNVVAEDIRALTDELVKAGCMITHRPNGDLTIFSSSRPIGGTSIVTEPFPGFATDLQAQMTAVLAIADRSSFIDERIFSHRRGHIDELNKMGAGIKIMTNRKFFIPGNAFLRGTAVKASDLRAGAALIIAALYAEGETLIDNAKYIFRGYENIDKKLKGVGADIEII